MTRPSSLSVIPILLLATGCANSTSAEQLRAQNERLRAEIERLETALRDATPDGLQPVPAFTVGLAASAEEFDSGEFEELLNESLVASAQERVTVSRETDDRQAAKVRGMLLQQYLAGAEIPILIRNLSFRLQDSKHEFKIGEQIVPRSDVQVAPADTGSSVQAIYKDPINAVMQRDSQGRYFIPYEELGGGSGRVQIQTSDAEILETEERERSQRQGDISFNWSLDLKQVNVYRVEGFRGDIGLFLSNMRYSGIQSSMAQYQTMRDAVFLFGYGRYVTSVINQIRTPTHVTEVEVLAIDPQASEALKGRLTEEQVVEIVGTEWVDCKYVDFARDEKIWERPPGVPFPFVSRQVSEEDGNVFYFKYSSEGVSFIGDYQR